MVEPRRGLGVLLRKGNAETVEANLLNAGGRECGSHRICNDDVRDTKTARVNLLVEPNIDRADGASDVAARRVIHDSRRLVINGEPNAVADYEPECV